MKYAASIIKLAGAYYVNEKSVIYAILRASGVNQAAALTHAFQTHGDDKKKEEKAREMEQNKNLSLLIQALKGAKRVPLVSIPEDTPGRDQKEGKEEEKEGKEGKVLQTLEDVRQALRVVSEDVDGKDRANVLVQLAKMMPDEQKPEEKRVHLYLPFASDCKNCALFQAKKRKK